jgi:histidine ammonia-lyase
MKINECAVINIELLKGQVAVLRKNCEIFREFNDHQAVTSRMRVINTIESIITESKPLEPIVRDSYCMGRIDIRGLFTNKYINETDI